VCADLQSRHPPIAIEESTMNRRIDHRLDDKLNALMIVAAVAIFSVLCSASPMRAQEAARAAFGVRATVTVTPEPSAASGNGERATVLAVQAASKP
jgi:hypothetical protein